MTTSRCVWHHGRALLLCLTSSALVHAAIPNAQWDEAGWVTSGTSRSEREYTFAVGGSSRWALRPEQIAVRIRDIVNEKLTQPGLWHAPGGAYSLKDPNPAAVIFFDIYFDDQRPDGTAGVRDALYTWKGEYRVRQRFDGWQVFEDYVAGGNGRSTRQELMSKTNRQWLGEGLSTVQEHRTEHLATTVGHTFGARDTDKLLRMAFDGMVGPQLSVASMAVLTAVDLKTHPEYYYWHFGPKLCLVTERQRLFFKQPNRNAEVFIISLDRVHVYRSEPLIAYLNGVGTMPAAVDNFTSLDVEFDRSRSEDADVTDEMRQQYWQDQVTLARVILEGLNDGSGVFELAAETKTKYEKAFEMIRWWDENGHRLFFDLIGNG